MSEKLKGVARTKAGEIAVTYELSPSLAIRNLAIDGVLRTRMAAKALTSLAHAFEGVPLDARILTEVAKRAFQEREVAIDGLSPEDMVRAILAA